MNGWKVKREEDEREERPDGTCDEDKSEEGRERRLSGRRLEKDKKEKEEDSEGKKRQKRQSRYESSVKRRG